MKHTEAAQIRATLSSLLSADPGREFSTEEMAAAIGQGSRTTGQILGGMARGKLIAGPSKVKGKKGKFWAWPVDKAPSEELPATPTRRTKSNATPVDEVELCIGGMTVIVGRNEATGRIRITLEP